MKTTLAAIALGFSFLTTDTSAKLYQHSFEHRDAIEAENEIGSTHRALSDTLEPWDIPRQRDSRAIMVSGDKSGGKYDSTLTSGEVKTAYGRNCKLELTEEGNLVAYRRLDSGEFTKIWQGGYNSGGKREYQTSLSRRGNLITRDMATGNVVWSSRSKDPSGQNWPCGPAQYVLSFFGEESCDLTLQAHRSSCPVPGEPDSFYAESFTFWWGNNHWIESENTYNKWQSPMFYALQKGESNLSSDLSMMLDDQCNLIVFRGHDLSDMGAIVWSSADDGAESVDPADDCHFFARRKDPNDPNDNGELVLYKGPYNRRITNGYEVRGPSYWSRPANCVRSMDGSYNVIVTETGPESYSHACDDV